ncbi:hypothetical protein ABW20_dc0109045 [Dactylellina cionopaga]|nr:hypothetical protein ABW20_dc0109045 [Dactylellina cionopaga]
MLFTAIILFLLTAASSFAQGQSNPLFPSHTFTIRPPEPCDESCISTICTTPESCTPCGTGQCTAGEECGTWAGKANHCCIQPYNFSPTESKLLCSDVSEYLSKLDVTASSAAGQQPKTYTADTCPSGEVIAAYEVFGDIKGGNLTCCDRGKDVVIVDGDTLSLPGSLLCIDELSAGAAMDKSEDKGGDDTMESGEKNGGNRMKSADWFVAVAAFVAYMYMTI